MVVNPLTGPFTLTLTKAELDVVVNHLGVGRYADVAALLAKISRQLNEQLTPQAPTPPEPHVVEVPRANGFGPM